MRRTRRWWPVFAVLLLLGGGGWRLAARSRSGDTRLAATTIVPAGERGDAPLCPDILGVTCPRRDRSSSFGQGVPFCAAVGPTAVDGQCRARAAGCAGLT